MPTLYLIRGVPGSGKTSLANKMINAGLIDQYYEADDFFYDKDGNYNFDASKLYIAHNQCQNWTWTALLEGLNVAVSNTSTTLAEVNTYKEIARCSKAEFVSLIVENRHDGVNTHDVPEHTLKKMKDRFNVNL